MTAPDRQRTLRRLTVIVAVQWLGATLALPLMPLFLERRGGTPTTVGVVMSAFFVAGLATQFAVGHLADRFGRRPLLVGGLLAYAGGAWTYLLPVGADWFALSRALQGVGAGAIEVASLSAVATLFPEAERGRAMSRIFAAQLAGLAMGPLFGSLTSVSDLGWAFLVAGVVSTLASLTALRIELGDQQLEHHRMVKVQRTPQLLGALGAAVATGLCVGVYETCWSLLMHHDGASTLEIRLSWTFFCLPYVALARFGGWLADHANRRVISTLGLLNAALFLAIYPEVHNVIALLALGPVESVGAALSMPSTSSLLSQGATPREMGRRQGLYTSANTAALAVSAALAGLLFSVHPAVPFTAFASASAVTTVVVTWWWRGVRGHVSEMAGLHEPSEVRDGTLSP